MNTIDELTDVKLIKKITDKDVGEKELELQKEKMSLRKFSRGIIINEDGKIAILAGQITREAFWELAKFRHPTHQIAFCTEESLKCLNFVEAEEI